MGFLNELVQVPVWIFGFVALSLFTSLYANRKLKRYESQDW